MYTSFLLTDIVQIPVEQSPVHMFKFSDEMLNIHVGSTVRKRPPANESIQ